MVNGLCSQILPLFGPFMRLQAQSDCSLRELSKIGQSFGDTARRYREPRLSSAD